MGNSIQFNFFATRDDLLAGILEFEKSHKIKYALGGLHDSPTIPVFPTAMEIPMFGISRYGNRVAEDVFFVVPSETELVMRTIQQRRGPAKNAIVAENVSGFAFSAGGVFGNEFIVDGSVGLVDGSEDTVQLCRAFIKALRQEWVRIQSYYVGPRAIELMKLGYRLVNNIKSPKSVDLKL